MLILFTGNNPASRNIAERLMAKGFAKTEKCGPDEWEFKGVRMLDTHAPTVIDVPTDFKTDCILVLSTHRSKNPVPMLTVHFPGNWGNAELGGSAKTLNTAYGSKLRQLFLAIKKANKDENWEVGLEADHHGPTCDTPIIFIEIGSSEKEWDDDYAIETIASAVMDSLSEPPRAKVFFGVGGGHYAREFSKIMADSGWAVGHILPKYAIDDAAEDVLLQAVRKSVEPVEKVLVLKESTNARHKEKIRKFCEKESLAYEEI